MKGVLLSIQPQHIENICTIAHKEKDKTNYKKTIEVRKSPTILNTPFTCFIYATKSNRYLLDQAPNGSLFCWDKKSHHYPFKDEENCEELFNGKVIGEFVCDRIDKYEYSTIDGLDIDDDDLIETCLDREEINIYANGKALYGWHITNLKIYDEPKELGEFKKTVKKCTNGVWYSLKEPITRPPQSLCYVEGLNE